MFQADDIGRVQRQARGRQCESRILAADPLLIKRAAGGAIRQGGGIDDRELLGADPGGVDRDAPGLDRQ
jgi:hypothetical protein